MKIALAICARNEDRNIGRLISSLLRETENAGCEANLYIYSDAPTDNTALIIEDLSRLNPLQIIHIKGTVNIGKVNGINTLLKLIKQKSYNYVLALDADVIIEPGTIKKLVEYMEKNTNIQGATPLRLPLVSGNRFQRLRTSVIQKKVRFSATHGGYKYLTGLFNITRGIETYKFIDGRIIYDDIQLNLAIPYYSIGICQDCSVYYDLKTSLTNQFRYKLREGRAFKALKQFASPLYEEQVRRISFRSCYLTGGLGTKLGGFLLSLNVWEIVVFITECLVNYLGFLSGYYRLSITGKSKGLIFNGTWSKIS